MAWQMKHCWVTLLIFHFTELWGCQLYPPYNVSFRPGHGWKLRTFHERRVTAFSVWMLANFS